MKGEYIELKGLQHSNAYKMLQALWAHQGIDLMNTLQKKAAIGQESAWRYYAGQVKGFELAISQLDRALMRMEKDGEGSETPDTSAEDAVRELLNQLKEKDNEK